MTRSVKMRLLLVLGIVCLGACSTSQAALADESASMEVELGFAGYYRLGNWTPITLAMTGIKDCQSVSVIAPDDEGVPTRFVFDDASIDTEAGQTRVRGCLRLGRAPTTLRVEIRQGRGEAAKLETVHAMRGLAEPVFNAQQFVAVLGDDLDLKGTVRLTQRPAHEAIVTSNIAPRQLPTQWFAWCGVDMLVVPTGNLDVIDQVRADQWEAIAIWVRMGGRLILSVGEHAEHLLGGNHPLSALAPGRWDQLLRQRDTVGLENYASLSRREAGQRIEVTDDMGRFAGVPAVKFHSFEGVASCSDGRGQTKVDWVIHRAYGLGVIAFVATDLDIGPMSVWEGRHRMLMKLLEDTLPGRHDDVPDRDLRSVTHFGFTDISGQLRSALEQFPGVRLVPFLLIGAIAIGFALLIGPVDYLLLGRDPERAKWTWLSFSLSVLVFTAGIVALAQFWKGGRLLANQVTLADYDSVSGTFRGTTWAHIYTPHTVELDARGRAPIELIKEPRLADQLFSWQGLAGSGFGGMNSRASIGDTLPPYTLRWQQQNVGWTTELQDLLIPRWSSRRFLACWRAEADGTSASTLEIAPRSGLISGTVTNPLPCALKSAYLCYDRWWFEIGDLKPGETYVIDQSVTPFDLHSRLTRRQIMDAKQIASPWNEESLEVPRIMEMIMFHDAAGGRAYTSLLHRQAAPLDLSAQLKLRRAILVARVGQLGGSELIASGKEPEYRNWNICRVLFPVSAKSLSD